VRSRGHCDARARRCGTLGVGQRGGSCAAGRARAAAAGPIRMKCRMGYRRLWTPLVPNLRVLHGAPIAQMEGGINHRDIWGYRPTQVLQRFARCRSGFPCRPSRCRSLGGRLWNVGSVMQPDVLPDAAAREDDPLDPWEGWQRPRWRDEFWSVGAIRFPETVSRQGMGSTPVGVTTRCSMSGAIPDPLGEGGTAFPPR
jgi:hypothetical protein